MGVVVIQQLDMYPPCVLPVVTCLNKALNHQNILTTMPPHQPSLVSLISFLFAEVANPANKTGTVFFLNPTILSKGRLLGCFRCVLYRIGDIQVYDLLCFSKDLTWMKSQAFSTVKAKNGCQTSFQKTMKANPRSKYSNSVSHHSDSCT